jgi:single stranded DNA-binding protein
MLNKVTLTGNVARTPKLSLTQDGKEMMKFSLATTQCWKACSRPLEGGEHETSEWQSVTDWHRIVVFQESALQWMKTLLKQGDPVYLEGKLSYHRWKDKYGRPRFTPYVAVTEEDGHVRCLHRSISRSQPEELKNLNWGLNLDSNSNPHHNVNPSPILSSDSQKKVLSREETFPSKHGDEEQDVSPEIESIEASKASSTTSCAQGEEMVFHQKNQPLFY